MKSFIEDEALEEFLDGQPRADTWRELRDTLAVRLKDAVESRDAVLRLDPHDLRLPILIKKIDELKLQVTVLAEEEAITRFVEDSVKATLHRPRPFYSDEGDETIA